MSEQRMTDNEVIKALDCCSMRSNRACSECPYHEHYDKCITKRNEDIVDLINRQKAEIERLQKETKLTIDSIRKLAVESIESAKSEAIKEFMERFQNELKNFDLSSVGLPDYDRGYKDCLTAVEDLTDNLLAELTDSSFTKIDHSPLCETETYEGR